MIKYLQHGEINKEKWDDCINLSPRGLVYALSWYLDAVHPGWEALVENDLFYHSCYLPNIKEIQSLKDIQSYKEENKHGNN